MYRINESRKRPPWEGPATTDSIEKLVAGREKGNAGGVSCGDHTAREVQRQGE